jgi:hypothetical protein
VRKSICAALFFALTFASLASAQVSTASGNPANLTYRPVSTKHLAASVAQQSSGFSITKYLPKISFPSFSKSPQVSPGPLPMSGPVPASAKNPFQPLAPFTPKK